MRIRSILPKFYESEDVGRMDWDTRLVFISLWSYCDDNGVGRDVDALICADLFPFDLSRHPRETLARVSRSLQTLFAGGQITRYTVAGAPFLFVNGWDAYQRIDRPAKERYPRPTSTNAEIRDTLATPSRASRDTLATGEGEKGRRGEGEKGLNTLRESDDSRDDTPHPTTYPKQFTEWYSHYPIKKDKAAALKAWRKAKAKITHTDLLAATDRYAASSDVARGYAKYPATWLNREAWLDEDEALVLVGAKTDPDEYYRALGYHTGPIEGDPDYVAPGGDA